MLAACAGAAPALAPEPQPDSSALVSARLGQTVRLGALRITPMRVEEDSRCPADANCIQTGTLRLQARLEAESGAAERGLTLDQPLSFGGRRIELVAGCPYPLASRPVPPAERRYVFSVGTSDRPKTDTPPDYCA